MPESQAEGTRVRAYAMEPRVSMTVMGQKVGLRGAW